MAQPAGKRSCMTLYTKPHDLYSHRVSIVLSEKNHPIEVIDISSPEKYKELLKHNPHGSIPTLLDRDLVLYETNIITEYLEERYPYPSLLPAYPIARAKSRQIIYRIEKSWYPLLQEIENLLGDTTKALNKDSEAIDIPKKQLAASLICLEPLFANRKFFFSDEFSLVDCCIAPLLWRLHCLEIKLTCIPKTIEEYIDRLLERPSVSGIKNLNKIESGVKI